MYSSCGDIETSLKVSENIENPDLVSWNTILSGLSGNGDIEKSIKMFIHFCRFSYVKPDNYTFAIIISAIKSLPASEFGKPLHGQVIKTGFDSNVYTGSTLVSMYFENSDTESVEKLQFLMVNKDIVFWTEMITGHCEMGEGSNAIKCFHEMSQEHKIDSFSISIAISACADLTTKNQGEMIHCLAIKLGFNLGITISGSLIDMYAKSGDLKSSEAVISKIETPDLKCWNCGLTDKGKVLWSNMKEKGLTRGSKHYSCFVGLLSRAGLLEECERMIMEFDGDKI